MQEEVEISYEKLFQVTCRQCFDQPFNGRSGIVFKTKQLKIPKTVMDSMPFFEIYFKYFIKCKKRLEIIQ